MMTSHSEGCSPNLQRIHFHLRRDRPWPDFKQRDHAELVQARNTLTEHIFGQVAAGATDEHRLVVSGLTHLKSIEKMTAAER
jgi:hypothetical protein